MKMTNEDIITMFKMMSAENLIDHEIVTDEDFLHIVEKWADVIQDTGLCGGLEHFTLIECKKALEKQIPRKPKVEGSGTLYYVCPECGKVLLIGYPCKCGQMIDWE